MQPPETQYTNVGDAQVAYQVFGEGPDLVWAQGLASHIDYRWEEPRQERFLLRLASFARVILFDRRGCGASDPLPAGAASSLEDWVDDLNAVREASGSEHPSLMASLDAGPMAMVFAATYPERIGSLILLNTGATYVRRPDYPVGIPAEVLEQIAQTTEASWGKDDGVFARLASPDQADDPDWVRWFARLQRASMTPRRAADLMRLSFSQDARHVLPLIHAPTLVAAATGYALIPADHARYLAEHIEGAKLLLLEGNSTQTYLLNPEALLDAIEEHVTGEHKPVEPDRILATVLFTDIVGSTERATQLGDRKWRELLDRHDEVSRREVARHGGKLVKTTGDGILATFDGPARAIRSAAAIRDRLAGDGVTLRVGLHAGEVEVRGEDVGGIAVHIASRVMSEAGANEILVSATVKGLVAGSELAFEDRGTKELKGIPDQWPLYALAGG